MLKTWNSKMITGYGTAFAPNVKNPYPHIDVPKFNNNPDDNRILDKWLSGGGNLETKVKTNIESIKKLNGIQIEYGNKDFFDWLPDGCKKLSHVLNESGIRNGLVEFDGNHGDKNAVIIENDLLPYFAKLLKIQ